MENETKTTGEVTFAKKENDRRQMQRPLERGKTFSPSRDGFAELVEAMKMVKQYNDNKGKGR